MWLLQNRGCQVSRAHACTIAAMLMHHQIDPVALQLGPVAIHWYGLTYLAAFAACSCCWAEPGSSTSPLPPFVCQPAPGPSRDVEDILFLGVMGVVLGGRIGYCLFYKPTYYLSHPLEIFAVWQGGMSFHGGMLGVLVAMVWYARSPPAALAAGHGLCGALCADRAGGRAVWATSSMESSGGRVADPSLPWGMVFRGAGDAAAPPFTGLPVPDGRAAAVRAALAVCTQAARYWAGRGGFPVRLRRVPLRGRVLSASPMRTWACCRWA